MKRAGLTLIAAIFLALPVSLGAGGLQLDQAAAGDLVPSDSTVCVAVPVFANSSNQGSCPAGEEAIDNSPGSGGAIIFYLKEILKLVNGLVGGIIVLVLVIAGVQYIASAGDPTRVKEAKKRITNAITALILYLLMFAILNFLVPGGIL